MRETRKVWTEPSSASHVLPASKPDERPISRIIEDILGHVGEIVRAEMRLVQTEIRQDFRTVRKAGTFLGAAGAALLFAVGFLLLAAVYGLSTVMPPWLAAISVGGLLGLVGLLLLTKGLHMLKATSMTPDRTIQSLEDNLRWVKTHVK